MDLCQKQSYSSKGKISLIQPEANLVHSTCFKHYAKIEYLKKEMTEIFPLLQMQKRARIK